jgi:PAS domain S-box-containing protein
MTAGVAPTARAAFNETRQVLDDLPRAVVATDVTGRILSWNRKAERVYRWMAAELTGWALGDVLGSGPVAEVAAGGGACRGELCLGRPDGGAVAVAAGVSPWREAEGAVVGIVAVVDDDLTELQRARQQADDLTEHLRLALAAGGLGTSQWDMVSGTATWDGPMERLYGLAPGSTIGTFDAWLDPRGHNTVVSYTDGTTVLRRPHGLTKDNVVTIVDRAAAGAADANGTAEAVRRAIELMRPIPDRCNDIALVVLRVR